MENRHMLMSALSVGIGVGIGLASGQKMSRFTGGGNSDDVLTPQIMEQEVLNLIVDGKDNKVSFDEFPYYLSEQTRVLLTSAAFVHLKTINFAKHTRNLSPASRTILLSGPTELYQQMLVKALACYFEAKLLLLDVTDFSLKIQSKYGTSAKGSLHKRSTSETLSGLFGSFSILPPREQPKGTLRRQSSGTEIGRATENLSNPTKLRRNASAAANLNNLSSCTPPNSASVMPITNWAFDEKLFIQTLYKVLVSVSKTSPVILYLRDVEKILCRSQRVYTLFQKMLTRLSGPILILGSRIVDHEYRTELDQRLSSVFPYDIEIRPPDDESHLLSWKNQLEEDMKMIQYQDNRNHIAEVLAANDLDCDDLGSICMTDTIVLSNYIEEIVVSAISYHLMNVKDPEYRNGKLVISSSSLSHGLNLFHEGKSVRKDPSKLEAQAELPKETREKEGQDIKPETKGESTGEAGAGAAGTGEAGAGAAGTGVAGASGTGVAGAGAAGTGVAGAGAAGTKIAAVAAATLGKNDESTAATLKPPEVPDNEFEKRIRPEVIPASEIGVTFADVGALDDTKESLQELVMLPLRRPDLFKGGLLKPCRGILLFGPPGTGKTMMAKAIASEAGASFINVSMSTITSKWFGEDEKNVRALFTLAAKVSPTIIFVDEVDSMLGQRSRAGEHEAMRKIKNEFMTHWDGLLTKQGERILVLAATNRPFDLDEAIIRRFERRILVGLPSVENREKILRTVLAKERVDKDLDFKELATMTEGYSGSDLKNLCTTAAYRPVRELIKQERLKDLEKKKRGEQGQGCEGTEENKEEKIITIRPLNMGDFREAKNQVAASFAAEGSIMSELKQWNDLYGEGGSRKKEQLSYFL